MKKDTQERDKNALRRLKRKKIFTIDQLVSELGCSKPTARSRMKQWGTYTSYNQNGRYYTLKNVPRFDQNGLWFHKDVYFSQHGNLKKTVTRLIQGSGSGLTGKEIGQHISLSPQTFLHHFRNLPGIQREKISGIYVYFSNTSASYRKQFKSRLEKSEAARKTLSDSESVSILIALIKHYDLSTKDIVALPELRTKKISEATLDGFLNQHELLKKKANYRLLKLLKQYREKVRSSFSSRALFPNKPLVPFQPEIRVCPDCDSQLNIRKTWKKTIVTMDIGAFIAKETVFECPVDKRVFTSPELRSLAPEQCTFGYDVIVRVGMMLFTHNRNEREIVEDLQTQNIIISEREVGNLGRKFVIYLALVHRESRKQLVHSMRQRGGYILHVDGTCEGDSPHLFSGIDGIAGIVLDNVKIPSERKEQLVPFFQGVKKQYGPPVALVHDMGVGILSAVREVFEGIPDFICHFHFLRDVGKDLLEPDNQMIIKRLRKLNASVVLRRKGRYLEKKITGDKDAIKELKISIEGGKLMNSSLEQVPTLVAYTLIQWIFDAPHPSRGYGFPFERPYLETYLRMKKVHDLLSNIGKIYLRKKGSDNRPFTQIRLFLNDVLKDQELKESATAMEEKAKVFDSLRESLSIALPEGKKGLNDDGDEEDITTIEKKMVDFRKSLSSDKTKKKQYSKMLKQMDKYWEQLFADPIIVDTPNGEQKIQPQRTNNILERFFRGEKRRSRKKSGNKSLNRTLKTILADTPFVRNLDNEEYQHIILNGCSSLAERFSQIDEKAVRTELEKAGISQEKIPKEVKSMVKKANLLEQISNIFLNAGK